MKVRTKHFILSIFVAALLGGSLSLAQGNSFFHLLGAATLPYTWTGLAGDNNWNTSGNWSDNLVPGVGDIARFNGSSCSGANCDATINANISVLGVIINGGYAGTITQATTYTVNIGTAGWTQSSGVFAGGDSNVTISGPFTLSGGTYTATSGQTLLANGWTYSAGTFNHNNGLLRFDNNGVYTTQTFTIALPGVVTLYKLRYTGGRGSATDNYTYNITTGSFDVQNEFQIGRYTGTGSIRAAGGAIALKGNLIVDDFGIVSGSYTPSNLTLDGTGAQTYTATGAGLLPNLIINKTAGTVTPVAGTTGLSVQSFTLTQGSFTGPAGNFRVGGSFTLPSGVTLTPNGTTYDFANYNFGGSQSYTITLDQTLDCVGINFGGGISGSSSTTTWTLAGTSGVINATGGLNIRNINAGTGAIIVNGGALNIAGNATSGAYAGTTGTTPVTFNGTGAQTYTKSGSGGNHGGQWIINKASGTLALATAVTLAGSGQDVTITTGTLNLAGFNLTIPDVLTIDTNGILLCNGGTLTAGSYSILGQISCGTGSGITWTGLAGDNLWSTAGNWTNNTIPGASDIALFNSACSFANCNAQIDLNLSVKGIQLMSSYLGTLTQNTTRTLTFGTSGFIQAGGTFAGGDSAITANGSVSFTGGTFTSTSGVFTLDATAFTVSGSPTYNHNNGKFRFASTGSIPTITPGSFQFYDVDIGNGTAATYSTISGTLTILNNLTVNLLTSCCSGTIVGGTIQAKGNVTFSGNGNGGSTTLVISGSANQTVTGASTATIPHFQIASTGGTVTLAGTLRFGGNFTHTSGTVDAGTSIANFRGSGTITTTASLGFYDVLFGGPSVTSAFTVSGTVLVNNALTFEFGTSCCGSIVAGGTIQAKGNVTYIGNGNGGSTNLTLSGSGNQTLTSVVTSQINNLTIASTGGTVTFSGSLRTSSNFTYTSGTVDASTSTVIFYQTGTITPGSISFNTVNFGYGYPNYHIISGTVTVLGALTIDYGVSCCSSVINSGTIEAFGNVTFQGTANGGTTTVIVKGSGNQTVSGVATTYTPNLTIASTGGSVTLSGTIRPNGNYTWTSGTVVPGTSVLSFVGTNTHVFGAFTYNDVTFTGSNATSNLSSGTLNVNGTLTFTDTNSSPPGSINSGTINAAGNVVFASFGKLGTATLNYTGTTSNTLTIGSSSSTLSTTHIVSKTGGGQLSLVANTSYSTAGRDFSVTSGTLNLAGYDFTVNDVFTVGASGIVNCSGGEFFVGTLTNGGTINCPGYSTYQFNWTGTSGDGNWNTAANWQGGVVPTSTDVVVFKDTYCGANCNATMNVAVSIKGIEMQSGYSGTITQGAGNTITVGAKGWKQTAGIFTGNNAAISNSGVFNLSGGTYTAPSATLSQAGNITISGTPTLNAGTSTLSLTNSGTMTFTPGSVSWNHVTFTGPAACNSWNLAGGTLNVNGTLTLASLAWCTSSPRSIDNGTIRAYGNIALSDAGAIGTATLKVSGNASGQTISTNGTAWMPGLTIEAGVNNVTLPAANLNLSKDYIVTSVGTLTTTGSTLSFIPSGAMSVRPGTATYNNVTFTVSGSCGSFDLGGDTLNVGGTLTIGSDGWCSGTNRPINNGTLKAYKNVTMSSNGYNGTAVVRMAGNATGQTITGTASAAIALLTFDHGANSLSMSGTVKVTGASTVVTGDISMSGAAFTTGTLALNGTTITKSGGILTVGGVVAGTGSLHGGTVAP
jgi:fibronectin-binding autotransporter adhesin